MWNKNHKMLLGRRGGGFFDTMKCKEREEYIWNGHPEKAVWQYTMGSQHLYKLNVLDYDQKKG